MLQLSLLIRDLQLSLTVSIGDQQCLEWKIRLGTLYVQDLKKSIKDLQSLIPVEKMQVHISLQL